MFKENMKSYMKGEKLFKCALENVWAGIGCDLIFCGN